DAGLATRLLPRPALEEVSKPESFVHGYESNDAAGFLDFFSIGSRRRRCPIAFDLPKATAWRICGFGSYVNHTNFQRNWDLSPVQIGNDSINFFLRSAAQVRRIELKYLDVRGGFLPRS